MQDNDSDAGEGAGTTTAMERRLFERLSFEFLREQRRARRWGIFFKLLAVLYFTAFLVLSMRPAAGDLPFGPDRVTALVDLQGVISHDSAASADLIASGLRRAFENDTTAGVILRINSPGGSPVQSSYISNEIYRLREKYPDIPIYAVVEDMCASGGYYVAAAAQKIFVSPASIVGSIGVRMDGFGFVDAMQRLGVERRLLTAGENKAFLDPFSPLKEDHVDHVRTLLADIHQQFVDTVRRGRGDRLAPDPDLFSGLFWTGEKSLELGLVDGFASSGKVARDIIGAEDIVDFTPRDYSLARLFERVGGRVLKTLLDERLAAPALRADASALAP